jgi:hypothetical protein
MRYIPEIRTVVEIRGDNHWLDLANMNVHFASGVLVG